MSVGRVIGHGILALGLTILTQLGGVAYMGALLARRWGRLWAFMCLYAGLCLAATQVAPAFGRVPLPCSGQTLRSQSWLYCALNRHYVSPDLKAYMEDLARAMDTAFPGTVTLTLDGNFPFLTGFPLLPHLSHDDGEKLDLAFYYRDHAGYRRGVTASWIGYWAFVEPVAGAPLPCAGHRDWAPLRWDMGWLAPFHRDLDLDTPRMTAALTWLTQNVPRGYRLKILLEPHVTARLRVDHPDIRFQGCHAARHDDHIHLQITAKTQ